MCEVVDVLYWFEMNGVLISCNGCDMLGLNWYVYLVDFDGYIIELYYGIE